MLTPYTLYTDGNRLYRILVINNGIVLYEDYYDDGSVEERITGEDKWELDVKNGELWLIGREE